MFRVVRQTTAQVQSILVQTDKKLTYPRILARTLWGRSFRQLKVSSKVKRDRWNPLFWSNLTNAMSRDNLGRLHRRSWLVSKKRRWLERHLAIFHAYRNFIRARTNADERTPAMVEGFAHRPCSWLEILSWRQDHGPDRSLHPLSPWRESPTDYRSSLASATT